MTSLQVIRYTDASLFWAKAQAFLVQHEAAHCLIIGLTQTLIQRPSWHLESVLVTVEDADGGIVAVALRTPPRSVILSLTQSAEAMALIADDLYALDPTMRGFMAAHEVGRLFGERWAALSGQAFHMDVPERIYQIETVKPVSNVSGTMRRITPDDGELILDWVIAFELEAFGTAMEREKRVVWVQETLDGVLRGVFVWEDGGVPVCMVGYAGPTPNGIRIGPVYTPPENRGRGYASACTAAATQMLMAEGARRYCFLFTDLNNPTSNKIYQHIGYTPVIDWGMFVFAAE